MPRRVSSSLAIFSRRRRRRRRRGGSSRRRRRRRRAKRRRAWLKSQQDKGSGQVSRLVNERVRIVKSINAAEIAGDTRKLHRFHRCNIDPGLFTLRESISAPPWLRAYLRRINQL